MTQNTFAFELVSPEAKLVSEDMAHVVIPGIDGEFGIGPKHAKFVISLKPGVVRMHKTDMHDVPQKVFIAGGFADITGESCSILAEEAVNVNDLESDLLREQQESLELSLSEAEDDIVKNRIERQLDVVVAKIAAL